MNRSTPFWPAMLAGIAVWGTAMVAQAGVLVMPPAGTVRIEKADAVIVGTVGALEPQDVKVDNTTYRIGVVTINQGLKGAKEGKTLRIGFIPLAKPEAGKIIIRRPRPIQLEPGQEGLFILKKHAKEDFYTIGGIGGYYFAKTNADFDKEVQNVKAIMKVLENPQAALKAKDADERLHAAALKIEQYRTFRGPNPKMEPIDAEESKLIMQALADSNWTTTNYQSLRVNPMRLFQRLGVTAADGFTPQVGGNYQAAAQTWVRENAEKYRIQRIVPPDTK